MRDLQRNETEPEEGASRFPAAMSVRRTIALVAVVFLVASVVNIGLSNGTNDRAERDVEVMSLMSDYSVDDVNILGR